MSCSGNEVARGGVLTGFGNDFLQKKGEWFDA